MARPSGSDDQDYFFLDTVITMALTIIEKAQDIKELSDEPEVLALAMEMEGRALVVQKLVKDYRPRLMELKKEKRKPVAETTSFLEKGKAGVG